MLLPAPLLEDLGSAQRADEVMKIMLGFCIKKVKHVILLAITNGCAQAYGARGFHKSIVGIPEASNRLLRGSYLSEVSAGKTYYHGPLKGSEIDHFYQYLFGRLPQDVFLLPITVNQKTPMVIALDNGLDALEEGLLPELFELIGITSKILGKLQKQKATTLSGVESAKSNVRPRQNVQDFSERRTTRAGIGAPSRAADLSISQINFTDSHTHSGQAALQVPSQAPKIAVVDFGAQEQNSTKPSVQTPPSSPSKSNSTHESTAEEGTVLDVNWGEDPAKQSKTSSSGIYKSTRSSSPNASGIGQYRSAGSSRRRRRTGDSPPRRGVLGGASYEERQASSRRRHAQVKASLGETPKVISEGDLPDISDVIEPLIPEAPLPSGFPRIPTNAELIGIDYLYWVEHLEDPEKSHQAIEILTSPVPEALDALLTQFPGKLRIDRRQSAQKILPASQHSLLIACLGCFEEAGEQLIAALASRERADEHFYTLLFCLEMGDERILPHLIDEIFHRDPQVRQVALQLTERFSESPAQHEICRDLRQKLGDSNIRHAETAANALGTLLDSESIQPLINLLEHSHRRLSEAAHQSLIAIALDDLGTGKKRWQKWFDSEPSLERFKLLSVAMTHKERSIRQRAANELVEISGLVLNYHPGAGKRDLLRARDEFLDWLKRSNRKPH